MEKMILLGIAALAAIVYWNYSEPGPHNEVTQSQVSHAQPSQLPEKSAGSFHGYDCTVDCSGHEAGYRWAEEHSISDGDDCDAAGEHSESPSFAEGCRAYVDGDQSSDSGDGSGDASGIVTYANGLAAVCHDLCLKICQAIGVVETLDQKVRASDKHLESAVQGYLREMEDTVKAAFDKALRKHGRGKFDNTELIIRALAESPLEGATENDLLPRIREREHGYRSANLKQFLQELQTEHRGTLLRLDNASGRYSFRDPIFRTVAKLREPLEAHPKAEFERLMSAVIKDLGWGDLVSVTIRGRR